MAARIKLNPMPLPIPTIRQRQQSTNRCWQVEGVESVVAEHDRAKGAACDKPADDESEEECFAGVERFAAQFSADHEANIGENTGHVRGSNHCAAIGGDHGVLQATGGRSEVVAERRVELQKANGN